MAEQPTTYTVTHEGQELLVTLWPDGGGEIATRRDGRWGPPSMLAVAP